MPLSDLVLRLARTVQQEPTLAAPLVVGSVRAASGGHWLPIAQAGGRPVWAVIDAGGNVRALIAGPPDDEAAARAKAEADAQAQMMIDWHDS